MKQITKTITVWEAEDGTTFEGKENCERYEDQLKSVEFFKVFQIHIIRPGAAR